MLKSTLIIIVRITLIIFICFFASTSVLSQGKSIADQKIDFLIGEWNSVSTSMETNQQSTGYSKINWIIDSTWLEWKFRGYTRNASYEVLTLIRYNKDKGQYGFYSFNPFDDHSLPHYGYWIDTSNLRLEIMENGEKIRIDFLLKDKDKFVQTHSKVLPAGKLLLLRKTYYSRIEK